jgi:serine/threonine protein phosphatase PrpC
VSESREVREGQGVELGEQGGADRLRLTSDDDAPVKVVGLSDVGCVREKNEDAFAFWRDESGDRGALCIVADGMGGAAAGEVASGIAVQRVQELYTQSLPEEDPAASLEECLRAANRAILEAVEEDPRLAGMGTTCTSAVLREGRLWVGHVGDSRAYLLAEGKLRQLTQDHSLAAELERQGRPGVGSVRNVLTRCLGMGPEVNVDVTAKPLSFGPGMRLVICSDGLTNGVADEEIERFVHESPPEEACDRLVELARRRGGADNITVLVATPR